MRAARRLDGILSGRWVGLDDPNAGLNDMWDGEHGRRLISILFAMPDTAIFADLQENIAYYNVRSGAGWDLAVAGYCEGPPDDDLHSVPADGGWWFSPSAFNNIHSGVEREHREYMEKQSLFKGRRTPWKYSGKPELVSFWANPSNWNEPDWPSLVSCNLVEPERSLSWAVEAHSDWRSVPIPREFTPGTRKRELDDRIRLKELNTALAWVASAAAGAAMGDGVKILMEKLFH